jgi:putative ABC transport system permease protein
VIYFRDLFLVISSGVEYGLLNSLLVVGLAIALRFGNFPDLTVEGSLSFGAALCAIGAVNGLPPLVCIMMGAGGGFVAGMLTSTLHLLTRMSRLLASIIVMTALYTVVLRFLHGSNLSIAETITWYSNASGWTLRIFDSLLIVIPAVIILIVFFHTEFGLLLRASGENWNLVQKLGKPCWLYLMVTLAVSNALVGVSGALITQYNGFADIGFGSGIIVTGLASLIIGETILVPTNVGRQFFAAVIGSFIYSILFALALKMGLNPWDFKFASAMFVVIAITISKVATNKEESQRIGCNPL